MEQPTIYDYDAAPVRLKARRARTARTLYPSAMDIIESSARRRLSLIRAQRKAMKAANRAGFNSTVTCDRFELWIPGNPDSKWSFDNPREVHAFLLGVEYRNR